MNTPATPLQPHQLRVIAERADLDERIAKLHAFFDTPVFVVLNAMDREHLERQFTHMWGYSKVLGERIDAFTAPAEAEAA